MTFPRTDEPSRDEVERWLAELKQVSCADLEHLIEQGALPHVLDVRTQGEFLARRIPGSALVPLHDFEDRIDELLKLPGPLYVHCEHGVRSMDACLILKWQGRDDVINVVEGLSAWKGRTVSG
jgi:rhodanese-related sulfurtransferase